MADDLLPASAGVGPLLQRDYWAVFDGCRLTPSEVVAHVRAHFCELPPSSIVSFTTAGGLAIGCDLDIRILPAQQCCVRVIHENAQSFTLGTLRGHPEAGRITFGAYRNPARDVVFHIRSRARSAGVLDRLGFLAIGDAMQTNTWTDFIVNTARAVGARIQGVIHAETQTAEIGPEDDDPLNAPTFLAVGD
ncbi:MAG TPA: DUF1990 family protein [Vicinamibacterales bacterium]|nr:DUF1990 family protein [Vicinamibacterales bacterium]